jgi:hypothetical protein
MKLRHYCSRTPQWITRLGGDLILSLVFAIAQFRMILLVFGEHYVYSIKASEGVVAGFPHWVIYQSRVLGPYTVQWLSHGFTSYTTAHYAFVIITAGIANLLILDTTRKYIPEQSALSAFFIFNALLVLLISPEWLYSWDHYGIIIFILFYRFVLSEKNYWWFAGLFGIAIFNRESAYFIALWMVMNPVIDYVIVTKIQDEKNSLYHGQLSRLAAGVTCFIGGTLIVHWLRTHLLVQEIMPQVLNLPELANKPFQIQLTNNLALLRSVFTGPLQVLNSLVTLFLITVILLGIGLSFSNPRRFLAFSLTHAAMVVSILCFGILTETRVLFELIPFVSFSAITIAARVTDSAIATKARRAMLPLKDC